MAFEQIVSGRNGGRATNTGRKNLGVTFGRYKSGSRCPATISLGSAVAERAGIIHGGLVTLHRDGNKVLVRPAGPGALGGFVSRRLGTGCAAGAQIAVRCSALGGDTHLTPVPCEFEYAEGGVVFTLPDEALSEQPAPLTQG